MNILCISSLDAANYTLENIIRELFNRGHHVEVFACFTSYNNVWMLKHIPVVIREIDELTEKEVDKFDVVLSANDAMYRVINYRKYIFISNMASGYGTLLSEGGDTMFMPGYKHYRGGRERNLSIVTGIPKVIQSITSKTNNMLFIESGHYPFGSEGKRQLAKLIIDICNRFNDRKLIIKPRFLKTDEERTHTNKQHLYDFIEDECKGTIPGNLIMLQEHKDMNNLLDQSDVVLCNYTNAFLDVVAKHKRVIVIGGLENKDSVDLNYKCMWKIQEEIISESGCIVSYDKVLEYLPNGIECNQAFIDKYTPQFNSGSSAEISVDIMEYLFSEYISVGKFPARIDTDAKNYKNEIVEDHEMNWERLIADRYFNFARLHFTRYFDSMGLILDEEEYLPWIENEWPHIVEKFRDDYMYLLSVIHEKIRVIVRNIRDKFRGNPIQESYWLKAEYDTLPSNIAEISRNDVLCKRSYDYFYGMYCYCIHDYKTAFDNLIKYIRETQEIEFVEYITDKAFFYNEAKRVLNTLFPFNWFPPHSKLILYGAGFWGNEYYNQIKESGLYEIVAIADQRAQMIHDSEVPYITPGEIKKFSYDAIFITVEDASIAEKINTDLCSNYGINSVYSRYSRP